MNFYLKDLREERDTSILTCPTCGTNRVQSKNLGRTACGAVGSIAGAAVGVSAALSGAEVGAVLGLIAGPPGAAIGGFAGAILGGLFGASAGCVGGAKVGQTFDRLVLENHLCLDCGHSFSQGPG